MKKCRVKIWGNPLKCPVCEQDIFYFRKVEIADQSKPGGHEICYLFECERCGHGTMFGGDNVAKYEAALLSQPVQHRAAAKKEISHETI